MAKNTAALKRGFHYDRATNHLGIHFNGEQVADFEPSASSTLIYVSPDGSDTTGIGTLNSPVATLTQAFTLVSSTRTTVMLAPGTYAEAATVAWPTTRGVAVIGAGCGVTTISATGTDVITVTPGVQTSTFTGLLHGVNIDHSAGSAQSGVTFDNTAMTKKLYFAINDCTFEVDETTDKSINVATHGDADNAIRVYISGTGNQDAIEGAIYFAVANNGDRLHCEQIWTEGTITTSATALEMRIRLYKCILPHEAALAGGNGLQYVTSVCSYSWVDYDDLTPEVYAAIDTNDLIGSHSEVIVA